MHRGNSREQDHLYREEILMACDFEFLKTIAWLLMQPIQKISYWSISLLGLFSTSCIERNPVHHLNHIRGERDATEAILLSEAGLKTKDNRTCFYFSTITQPHLFRVKHITSQQIKWDKRNDRRQPILNARPWHNYALATWYIYVEGFQSLTDVRIGNCYSNHNSSLNNPRPPAWINSRT